MSECVCAFLIGWLETHLNVKRERSSLSGLAFREAKLDLVREMIGAMMGLK